MSRPFEWIDQTLEFVDSVDPSDDAEPTDNLVRRRRLLFFAQRMYATIHNYRAWRWTYKDTSVTIPAADTGIPILDAAGSVAGLIPDFLELSRSGSIYDTAGTEYKEKSRWIVNRLRRQYPGGSNAGARVFMFFGGKIEFPYAFGSDTDLIVTHRFKAEKLLDRSDVETNPAIGADDDLVSLPDTYHDTVMIPALTILAQTSKSDSRTTWVEQFRSGLERMVDLEFPEKSQPRRMPLANRKW